MIEWIIINLNTDLIKYIADPQEHTTNNTRRAKNELINQGAKTDGVHAEIYKNCILTIIQQIIQSQRFENVSTILKGALK